MKVDVQIPSLGESVTQAVISRWIKADGDIVSRDEPLCELETDKANVDLPSPASGRLKRAAGEGDTVQIGQVVASIDTEAGAGAAAPSPKAPEASGSPAAPVTETRSPVAAPSPMPAVAAASAPPATAKPRFDAGPVLHEEGTRREPMSKIRRAIAERLVAAKNQTAMLTTFNEADMSAILDLKERNQESFQRQYGVSLGLTSFFAKASATALKEFPNVNAFIEGEEVVYHDYVHLGLAVSTDRGLVVPVLRNVERMGFAKIESEIKRVAGAARAGKLGLNELSGATFTITNGGVFGSLLSTPILTPPQTAILGLHAIQRRPIAVGDRVEIRPMMYLALSYDHRLIDGKDSVSFLVRLKQLLEDPAKLVFDL